MSKHPDYYAILGVASNSDDVVIRAAYKALMLKYHPDTNGSSDAHRKAASINEAFEVLGDPQKRAQYDQFRKESRGSKSPPPPPPPPRPPNSKASDSNPPKINTIPTQPKIHPWMIVCALAVGGGLIVMQGNTSPIRSTSGNSAVRYMPVERVSHTIRENAPSSIAPIPPTKIDTSDLFKNIYGEPKPLSGPAPSLQFEDIESMAKTFERVLTSGGIQGARKWSETCHAKLKTAPSWAAADRCAAFDFAASRMDNGMVQSAGVSPNSYFQFQASNQVDYYTELGALKYMTDERLRRIDSAIRPALFDAISSGITRRKSADLLGTGTENSPSERSRQEHLIPALPKGDIPYYVATVADYPVIALAEGRQGTVSYRAKVDGNGRVISCHVTSSSGSLDLDNQTCILVRSKARFFPIPAANGVTSFGVFDSSIQWELPT